MKKKFLAMLLTAAMAVTAFAGCGAKEENNEATKAPEKTETGAQTETKPEVKYTLMNEGTLTVGSEVGYPPFEDFAEDGVTPIGFDMDIISEVAKRMGLKVNVINTAWDGIFAGIDVNYDVVCSACTITAARQETMSFSTPYINNYQSIVLLADDDTDIKNFYDLDKKVIAVQKETTSDELMSDYKATGTIDVEIVANEKVVSCFTQLTNKEIDAVVVDSTVADGYLASNPGQFKIVYKDDKEPEMFGIAMGKNNDELRAAINEVLAQMEADGFIADTYNYWFGSAQE